MLLSQWVGRSGCYDDPLPLFDDEGLGGQAQAAFNMLHTMLKFRRNGKGPLQVESSLLFMWDPSLIEMNVNSIVMVQHVEKCCSSLGGVWWCMCGRQVCISHNARGH